MVDAYQDITIPFQMSSVEFFTLVKEHLTDDKAPVELLDMKVLDELIQDEVSYYKNLQGWWHCCIIKGPISLSQDLFSSTEKRAIHKVPQF